MLKKCIVVSFFLSSILLSSCSIINKVQIQFKNYDNSVLETSEVQKGGDASYNGEAPTKPRDASYYYIFDGWDKSLDDIDKDTEFYAVYKSYSWYTLTFVNEKGSIIHTQEWFENKEFSYSGIQPQSYIDGNVIYLFSGWSADFNNINSNQVVYPKYIPEEYNQGNLDFEYELLGDDTYMITGSKNASTDGSIIFPSHYKDKQVTAISYSAFANQSWIRSIQLGYYMRTLSKNKSSASNVSSFSNCTSLFKVTFNDLLEDLGSGTFYGCNSLRTIVLPPNIDPTKIATAFFSCNNLSFITTKKTDKFHVFDNVVYSADEKTLLFCPNNIYLNSYNIRNKTIKIGNNSFSGNRNITKVVLNEKLEVIGDNAFSFSNLSEIIFNNNLKSIYSHAFSMTKITSLIFPDSLEGIDGDAFLLVPIKTITFGKNLKVLGNYVHDNGWKITSNGNFPFSYLGDLIEIKVEDSNPNYYINKNCLVEKATNKILMYPGAVKMNELFVETLFGSSAFRGSNIDTIRVTGDYSNIFMNAFKESKVKNLYFYEGIKVFFNSDSVLPSLFYPENFLLPRSMESLGSFTNSSVSNNLSVFYGGDSIDDFYKISMNSATSEVFKMSNIYLYSESKKTNYWHYSNGIPMLW